MSIAGSLSLTRPGYSVDEEFTVFAVRGIQRTACRFFPRAFSTIAVSRIRTRLAASAVTGSELPAFAPSA